MPYRSKAANSTTMSNIPWCSTENRPVTSGSGAVGGNTAPQRVAKHGTPAIRVPHVSSNNGVWTWLGQRRGSGIPDPLSQPSSSPAENHYTHMDDSYNPELGEALYAELDRESLQSGNPSYQNTAYSGCGEADKELQMFSSAPSSAYYSDMSVTTTTMPGGGERTYEIVGTGKNQNCCPLLESESDGGNSGSGGPREHMQFNLNLLSPHPSNTSVGRRNTRLSAINEGSYTSGAVSGHAQQPSEFV